MRHSPDFCLQQLLGGNERLALPVVFNQHPPRSCPCNERGFAGVWSLMYLLLPAWLPGDVPVPPEELWQFCCSVPNRLLKAGSNSRKSLQSIQPCSSTACEALGAEEGRGTQPLHLTLCQHSPCSVCLPVDALLGVEDGVGEVVSLRVRGRRAPREPDEASGHEGGHDVPRGRGQGSRCRWC